MLARAGFAVREICLWDDVEPGVDRQPREARRDGATDAVVAAELEPQRQQAQNVLQRALLRERDGVHEAYDEPNASIRLPVSEL